jgi:hypothetical protein
MGPVKPDSWLQKLSSYRGLFALGMVGHKLAHDLGPILKKFLSEKRFRHCILPGAGFQQYEFAPKDEV